VQASGIPPGTPPLLPSAEACASLSSTARLRRGRMSQTYDRAAEDLSAIGDDAVKVMATIVGGSSATVPQHVNASLSASYCFARKHTCFDVANPVPAGDFPNADQRQDLRV
jgi:hypothetical protein